MRGPLRQGPPNQVACCQGAIRDGYARPNRAVHLTRPRYLIPAAHRLTVVATGVAAGQVSGSFGLSAVKETLQEEPGRSQGTLYAEVERAVNRWRGEILSAIPEYKAATQIGWH